MPVIARAANRIFGSRSCRRPSKAKNRVSRQRLVYETLKDEFAAGLHALALTTLTPDEDKAKV